MLLGRFCQCVTLNRSSHSGYCHEGFELLLHYICHKPCWHESCHVQWWEPSVGTRVLVCRMLLRWSLRLLLLLGWHLAAARELPLQLGH